MTNNANGIQRKETEVQLQEQGENYLEKTEIRNKEKKYEIRKETR